MKLQLATLLMVTCFAGSAFPRIGDTEAKWLTRFPGARVLVRDVDIGHITVELPNGDQVSGIFTNHSCELQMTALRPGSKSREPLLADVEQVANQYGGHLDSWTFYSPKPTVKKWLRPDQQLLILVERESDGGWYIATMSGSILAQFKKAPSTTGTSASAPAAPPATAPTAARDTSNSPAAPAHFPQSAPLNSALAAPDAGQTFARIGDTRARVGDLYGGGIAMPGGVMYSKAGFDMVVSFRNDRAVAMTYVKSRPAGGGEPLPVSELDIEKFRQVNGAGKRWVQKQSSPEGTVWETEDGALTANRSSNGFFVIQLRALK